VVKPFQTIRISHQTGFVRAEATRRVSSYRKKGLIEVAAGDSPANDRTQILEYPASFNATVAF
jgi:hypothetical protein